MVFKFDAQFLSERRSVSATRRGGVFALDTPAGPVVARTLTKALRSACEIIGPLMERGDRAGEGWGLLVTVGGVCVPYGNWPQGPPAEPSPEIEGLRRILDEYRPEDGARAALNNAAKIVEAFAARQPRRQIRAA
jgi:hypothetical protein